MRDRFVGDVGDLAKFGMLRSLFESPARLGVVWYYVSPDAESDAEYAPHFEYLNQPDRFRNLDRDLFDTLNSLVREGPRTVEAVEQSRLLPRNTLFFRDPLPIGGQPRSRELLRKAWIGKALEHTKYCDVVFLDPDIGFPPKSVNLADRSAELYAFPDEMTEFHKRGQTVVIYQHRRLGTPDEELLREFFTMFHELGLEGVCGLRWKPWAPRFFFIFPNAHTRLVISERIGKFLSQGWNVFFTPITNSHASQFPGAKEGPGLVVAVPRNLFRQLIAGITALFVGMSFLLTGGNFFEALTLAAGLASLGLATYLLGPLLLYGFLRFKVIFRRHFLGPLLLTAWLAYVVFVAAGLMRYGIPPSLEQINWPPTGWAIVGLLILVWGTLVWRRGYTK